MRATSDLEQLELEAFKAISGADYARSRLLHGLSMGTPSIEDEIYLIKTRVKRVDSLILKVLDRRNDPDSATYRPSDARDIVGLRLLTLFKNDLPILVRRFMSFVEWSQRPPFSLFYGHSLCDAVAEIKIYATSDVTDLSTDFVIEEFEGHGFGRKAHGNFVPIEVVRKGSQYSSIHIVVWANGPNQSITERVPVEVQLRTSLEDAWGEVDHRLRYKSRSFLSEALRAGRTVPEKTDNTIATQLGILKRNLDSASDFADLLGTTLKNRVLGPNIVRPFSKLISFDIDRLVSLESRDDLKPVLVRCADTLKSVYQTIHSAETTFAPDVVRDLLGRLSEVTDDLHTVLKEILHSGSSESAYWIKMEIALCWYWRAILLRALAETEKKPQQTRDMYEAIKQSIRQYLNVQGESEGPNALLSFRIANVIALRGEYEFALSKHQSAFEDLDVDPTIPHDHHLRLRIPRSYALALWDAAERSKQRAIRLGSETLFEEERRAHYLKALDVTLPLYGQKTGLSDTDRSSDDDAAEHRTTVNNIIEYALSFLGAGGNPAELVTRGLSKEGLARYLKELIGPSIDSIHRVSLADTVREAARWLGDRALAVEAAHKVLELITVKDFWIILPDFAYIEMEAEAHAEIERGENEFPSYPRSW